MDIKNMRIILLPVILLLLACMPTITPRSQVETEMPLIETPAALAVTVTPSTLIPSLTVIPTQPPAQPTVTLAPTATPVPLGLNSVWPYVLYKTNGGIWISNPDGTFPILLAEGEFFGDLRRSLNFSADRLALVMAVEGGLDLVIVKIPSGEMETITPLVRVSSSQADSPDQFPLYAIRDYDNVDWQPEGGRLLAFTGAVNGPTSDLYMYDSGFGTITQLTDGPAQAVMPNWSTDGQVLLHFGVSWVPPFGGAIGAANRLDGMWSVTIKNGEVITLPKPIGTWPHFVGWVDATHFITFDSDDTCFAVNLRKVDALSGSSEPVMPYSFYYQAAYATGEGSLLFPAAEGCASSPGDGIFLLPEGESESLKLDDKKAYEVEWMPESRVFNAYPEALFSADGSIRYDPPVYEASYLPAVSSQGYQAWYVIQDRKGRVVVNAGDGEWLTVIEGHASQLLWDPLEGKTLLIAMEDGGLYAAAYPDFVPVKTGMLDGKVNQAVWGW